MTEIIYVTYLFGMTGAQFAWFLLGCVVVGFIMGGGLS